jgi:hypothetical protein
MVPVIYILGLINTQNLGIGLTRAQNSLSMLILPVIIFTSAPLSRHQLKLLLILFSLAVFLAASICMGQYFRIDNLPNHGFRSVSIFMLHSRFALLINMAIFIMLYFAFFQQKGIKKPVPWGYLSIALLLILFLFFLRTIGGLVTFVILLLFFFFHLARTRTSKAARMTGLNFIWGCVTALIGIMTFLWFQNFHASLPDRKTLDLHTANGHAYTHNLRTGALENGHFIDLYVCEPELEKEWNKVSTIPFDGIDHKGQAIRITLRRYLTSKGLRKDSAAFQQLSQNDIQRIEIGLANCRFKEQTGIFERLYESLWEVHILVQTGYVNHHTLGQRYAFMINALHAISKHPWLGVGIGDVYDTMLVQNQELGWTIDPKWEGKPHNQFLFYALAFGIPGALLIFLCLILPIMQNDLHKDLLFNLFSGIILLSMLSIDTFESYDSIVFFSVFYSLFISNSFSSYEVSSS